jgi:hypothetical protein
MSAYSRPRLADSFDEIRARRDELARERADVIAEIAGAETVVPTDAEFTKAVQSALTAGKPTQPAPYPHIEFRCDENGWLARLMRGLFGQ